MREIRRGALVAAMLGCVILAGCDSEPATQAEPESFDTLVASAIDEAKAGGAGEAQLAILERSQSEGEVSLEDARAATRAAVDCINAAGSSATYEEATGKSGLIVPGHSSLANTDEQLALADKCDAQEYWWVFMVYTSQPTSQGLQDAYLEQQVPLVRSCLEKNGHAAPSDATTIEVLRQATDVKTESDGAVDCLAEAKIEGF